MKRANSCRTSDRSACLFPRGPGCFVLRGRRDSLFALIGSAADKSDGNAARASAIMKGASPSPHSKRPEEPKTKTEGPTMNPKRTPNGYLRARRPLRHRRAAKRRGDPGDRKAPAFPWIAASAFNLLAMTSLGAAKCSGGQRKSLKRRDSAKESKDFNLDFVPPDLEFVPSGLDFVPKNLDFLHPLAAPPSPRSWQTPAAVKPQIRSSDQLGASSPSQCGNGSWMLISEFLRRGHADANEPREIG